MPAPPVPPELDAFLREPNPAVVATLRPDGSPHSVPTWYDWEDGLVLLNMDASRKRLEHLRRDPRVSLTVLQKDDWYSHVTLFGVVERLEDDPDLTDIDRLSRRYRDSPFRNRESPRVSAWMRPTRWTQWPPKPSP
jgi:PPOX class probable F420-dependent enzyme